MTTAPPTPRRPGSAPPEVRRRPRRADRWLGRVAAVLLRGLARTWRLEVRGESPVGRSGRAAELAAFWHRDVLVAALVFRDTGHTAPVSRSRDGDRIAAAMEGLGLGGPPRGSSSRGGVPALRALVRRLAAGTTVAVPVDGPRGPAGEPKPGVLWLAQRTGIPITPVAFAARPAWRFGSWDRTRLPWPFARVVCGFGDPVPVAAEGGAAERERARARLGHSLDALAETLERALEDARRR